MRGTRFAVRLSSAVFLIILSGLAQRARATIIVKDSSINTATGVFTYVVTLDSTTEIASGNGFTIYDFLDYVSGSATLTPVTGSGTLGLSQISITEATTDTSPVSDQDQGTDLNDSVAVNELATQTAEVDGLPNIYADPDAPTDGLTNPTFDNGSIPNLSFVFDSSTPYMTTGAQTYLLTLDTSLKNTLNQTSDTVVTTEDLNTANSSSTAFAENLLLVPAAAIPEPATLGLMLIGAGGLLMRRRPA
jgi:hypothetical protein